MGEQAGEGAGVEGAWSGEGVKGVWSREGETRAAQGLMPY